MAIRGTNRFLIKNWRFRCFQLSVGRTYQCFFFDLSKQIPVAFVSWFPVFSENLEMRGIHPRSSRLRNERSTFWATSPLRKLVDNDIWSHSSVNAKIELSLPFHIVLLLAMSMRFINPFVSHMPMDWLFDWAATLVWSNGAFYVTGRSLIHMSVEQCFLRRLCEVKVGNLGHQSLSR